MGYRDNAFNLPIRIDYQAPKALVYFITVTHTGALLCLSMPALPLWMRMSCMVPVLVHYLWLMRGFNTGQSVKNRLQLLLDKNNKWSLLNAENVAARMTLQTGAFVHGLLLVLRFVAESGKSYCFILTPANVDHDSLRRLRVRLRHGGKKVEKGWN